MYNSGNHMISAAYSENIITPVLDKPVYLAGFDQNRLAQSIHDDLWARALALRNGDTCVVLIALDLIGLGREHCQAVEASVREAYGADVDVLVSSSHTHFGPDTIGFWGPSPEESGVDPDYMAWLKLTIARTALTALQAESTSVQVRTASRLATGVAKNARDPEILDEEVTCVQFVDEHGTTDATLVIYPCHPEVLEPTDTVISSDYVHALRETIEEATGAPALFMPGALGGMMTPAMPDRTHDSARSMGVHIARTALDALSKAPAGPDPMTYQRQTFAIPMENPLFLAALAAGLLSNQAIENGVIMTEAGLLRIGGAWLAAVPGELLPKLGLSIKKMLLDAGADIAGVIGLANDELGYILPPEDFVYPENPLDPGDHYEETMSVGRDTAPRLLAALAALIDA